MPQVNRVTKARKDQGPCSACAAPVKSGDSYVWWKSHRGSPRKIRCGESDCFPTERDLTESEFDLAVFGINDLIEAIEDGDGLKPVIEKIRTLSQLTEQKLCAMPAGCQSGKGGHRFRVRFEALEDWVAGLEASILEYNNLEDIEDEPDTEGVITEQQFESWKLNLPELAL